jgi:hypothetical protein
MLDVGAAGESTLVSDRLGQHSHCYSAGITIIGKHIYHLY